MIKNEFEFHPVGQGLFYTGIIGDFVMVYDIGTLSRQKYIENEIDLFSKKLTGNNHKKVIDVLFLSHYDYDHISGIEYLLKSGFIIKKIIAPLITPLVELSWLSNTPVTPTFPYRSLQSILQEYTENLVQVEAVQESDTTDIQITSDDEDSENLEDISLNTFRSNQLASITTMKLKNIWQFTFFAQAIQQSWVHDWLLRILTYLNKQHSLKLSLNTNTYQNMNNDELADKIYTYVNQLYTPTNVNQLYTLTNPSADINVLIKEIRDITDNLGLSNVNRNMVSLILYHRPIKINTLSKFKSRLSKNRKLFLYKNNAQLLTGDSVFRDYKHLKILPTWHIFRIILPHFKYVDLMLLPHHGSKYGWHDDLLAYTNRFVVSYGLGNRSLHPHTLVINTIIFDPSYFSGRLIEVNQQPNSGLLIYVV